jgi:tetratricopeptide (TPR) repeat protein
LRFSEFRSLALARRYDEAIELHRSLNVGPTTARVDLGGVYAAKGMHEQALIEYRRASGADLEKPYALITLGHALAMSGREGEARAILDRLKDMKGYVSPAELTILYAGLGEKEGAFASLERAYAAHDLQLKYLKVEPHYDGLRSDPRFTDLMRRVGLSQ